MMTEPKELARQARLLIQAASALQTLLKEVKAHELLGCRYETDKASEAMLKAALTCPGLRVAVFADSEGEGKQ